MTPSDEAALKEFLRADEKRTPGEWRTHDALLSVYAGTELVADAESSSGASKVRANSDFIASASRIAQPIRALMGSVEELEGGGAVAARMILDYRAELAALASRNRQLAEALERIASCKSRVPGDVVDIAQKALAAQRQKGETK